jgi:hypothetical protein
MSQYVPFAKAAAERAVKTFAQTLAALLGAQVVGIHEAPWTGSLSVAAMAAVLSLLTSVGSARFGGDGPSLSTERIG